MHWRPKYLGWIAPSVCWADHGSARSGSRLTDYGTGWAVEMEGDNSRSESRKLSLPPPFFHFSTREVPAPSTPAPIAIGAPTTVTAPAAASPQSAPIPTSVEMHR